jgi:hypothetical protein
MPKIVEDDDPAFVVMRRLDVDLPEDNARRRKPYVKTTAARFEEYDPETRALWEIAEAGLTLMEAYHREEILNWEHQYGPGSWGKPPPA